MGWVGVLLAGSAFGGCSGPSDIELTDLAGTVHKPVSPPDAAVHVLVFLTTDCPIANAYAPRIQQLIRQFAGTPTQFFLVHVDPDVTPDVAQSHAAEYGYQSPILLDHQHELVRHTGVTVTPEAAVIAPGGQLVYRGRIDNWYGDLGKKRPRPTRHELHDALKAVLADSPVEVPRPDLR